jgi:2-polyprenyl-3-methyl-5-hydroxy-6-metoxy-1,4-benzoquinol methylase
MSILSRFQRYYPGDKSSLIAKLKVVIEFILIKFFNRFAYPNISLLKYMQEIEDVENKREFLIRYFASKNDWRRMWESQPRETKEQIESFYNEHDKDVWRQVYLSHYGKAKRRYILMVTDIIANYSKNPQTKILDYGCGCGVYGNYLYQKGYRDIILADIKSGTFDFAQMAFDQELKFLKLDRPEPLTDNYDVVLLIDCLAHAFNPYDALRHVLDHLKPGGLLIVYYEHGVEFTHLATASLERQKTMDFIYENCRCLKKDEVFIKN